MKKASYKLICQLCSVESKADMVNFAADNTFASLCLTEVKVPTRNKKAAKVFYEEEWCEKDFRGTF